ncbi:MAG TPA: hypothetical protein VFX12_15840 [Vicinamibacterales bacterium]|nr:hypothetical protein [Vicinamibacterales bacterium]
MDDPSSDLRHPTSVPRRLPPYAWIGLATMAVSEIGMLRHVEPFWSWHTPIAWTGYILLVDGLVWRRRGDSWLRNARAEFCFLAAASIALWVVFELYNAFALHNWYYVNLPANALLRYFGYAWAFATISPAIFETGELIAAWRDRRAPRSRRDPPPLVPLGAAGWTSVLVGLGLVLLPILHPSPWLAAPVWLGFIFLFDPLNAAAGAESIRSDLRAGQYRRLIALLLSGLACGFIWEFWNDWSRAKWIYTVPVPPHVKLFEMPLAGFGGFPPFAVECFTMYVFVRHWIWRGVERPISL